ncbi:uncharacterized protein [Chaetodon trifascialis]|uniref:uncharacterized protein isoform X1 n=1 Tax=Chaetodon trifascialis TaxID=109706 RepID=UPI0039946E39
MGSGTSRGKKVAPACVSEVNVSKTAAGTSPKQDHRPFKPLKIHAILRNARNRAQPDCHSEGHDSDFSREDDDIDGELDTVLADYEEREGDTVKKTPPKKTVIRSKTYGLCHFSQEDEEDFSAKEPRGSNGGSRGVNKRSNDAFTHFKRHTPAPPSQHSSSSQGFLTRGALLEAVPTPEKQSTFGSCHSSSLTMPVILYDGSEEELMDTIEREFS